MSDGTEPARWLLRGVVGGTMIAHGVKHARSLEGTAGWFDSIGFDKPELQAKLSAVVEIGAGRWSVDHALGQADRLRGGRVGLAAAALGLAGAAGQLRTFWRTPGA